MVNEQNFNKEDAQKLEQLEKEIKEKKAQVDELKSKLKDTMEREGVEKADFDTFVVNYIQPQTKTTIDLKALEKQDEKAYNYLLENYGKEQTRKGNIRIKLRD